MLTITLFSVQLLAKRYVVEGLVRSHQIGIARNSILEKWRKALLNPNRGHILVLSVSCPLLLFVSVHIYDCGRPPVPRLFWVNRLKSARRGGRDLLKNEITLKLMRCSLFRWHFTCEDWRRWR